MKRFVLLFCFEYCLCSMTLAQPVAIDESRLHDYMTETYGISDDQFKAYMEFSSDFDRKNEELESKRITVDEFKKLKRQLYDEYYGQVKSVFDEKQYFEWSTCLERLDRYRYLSERLYVPRQEMRALYNTERKWKKEREELWNSNIDESMKHQKNNENLKILHDQIRQILGETTAEAYSKYKAMDNMAVRNMKKYSASYNEAMKITEIEAEYKVKRQVLNSDKSRKRVDIDADITMCEKEKAAAIKKSLPEDVYERWQTINDDMIDYTLRTVYGMNKKQIAEYKNAYNEYVLKEYFILGSKQMPASEKAEKLVEANICFCEKVRSFAPAETYEQWFGRRQYVFERRMEQKGIIQ